MRTHIRQYLITYSSSTGVSAADDGNPATGWSASSTDTNAWWQVDLGSSVQVAQLQVVARQDLDQAQTRTGFQVELSNDPAFASYTTVASETGSVPDAGSASFNVTTTVVLHPDQSELRSGDRRQPVLDR